MADAVSRAKVVNVGGGEPRESFFYPAVLYPVTSEMRVYQEEQFGLVVPIVPYRELETVIDYVLDSDVGQQLSIFGSNSAEVGTLVDAFANQAGRITINAPCQRGPDSSPFNGRKNPVEGTLSVHDALRFFRFARYVKPSITQAKVR